MALMRALPNMTVIDLADAVEIEQAVTAVADHQGPVYLRLKRGEIPVIFDETHQFSLKKAQLIVDGDAACIVASGMMVPAAIVAATTLAENGVATSVVNCPVVKPIDTETVLAAARRSRVVVTAENHSVVGGLGSAVAEIVAEAGLGVPLRRVGIKDVFGESGSREYLFDKFGLGVQHIVDAVWQTVHPGTRAPIAPQMAAAPGTYAPV